MHARDAMITNPLVVRPETALVDFVRCVLDGNQTTASVVDGDRLVGMVSVEDVFRRLVPHYVGMRGGLADVLHDSYYFEAFERLKGVAVRDVMCTELDCMDPDEPLMHAVGRFLQKSRKTLPVLEGGKFLGAVTRRSVLSAAMRKADT